MSVRYPNNEISNIVIWNNRHISINDKSAFNKDIVRKGIIRVGDLITQEKRLITQGCLNVFDLSPVEWSELMSIVNALPQ